MSPHRSHLWRKAVKTQNPKLQPFYATAILIVVVVVVVARAARVSHKMLCSLSGPLYFGPKCRKHAYKVYHQNRDCTIPACKPHLHFFSTSVSKERHSLTLTPVILLPDFKRCARLLTRLAVSPQCTDSRYRGTSFLLERNLW